MSGHIAWRARGDDVTLEVDVVVVGSGAGGATAAVSLARHGLQVAVVEAGAWRDPEHYPHSGYAAMRDLMPSFGAAVTLGRAQWPVVQGRAVGGSTVINSAICYRTPADVFDEWTRDHGVDGARMRERVGHYQDELEAELGVEAGGTVAGVHNTLAHEGARALGTDGHDTARFVRGCRGAGRCLQGCRDGHKQSLNLNFMPEVLERGGLVLSCAPVERVLLEGGRAVGVRGRFEHPRDHRRGARFTVRARRAVFVAASVTGSPVLLRRSGLRIRALGRHFRAHPGAGVFGLYDRIVDMNLGVTQGWSSTAFRLDKGFKLETLALPAGLAASRIKGGGSVLAERLSSYRHLAFWVFALRAHSVGSIYRGPFGPIVRYTLDAADMLRFRDGAVTVARTHFAAGARAVLPGVHGLPYALEPDQLSLLEQAPLDPRCWVGVLTHLFGGCVMGADPDRSVCDTAGRVRGVEGLVIADASQIPGTIGVNPQHTIMALARLRADQLVGVAEA